MTANETRGQHEASPSETTPTPAQEVEPLETSLGQPEPLAPDLRAGLATASTGTTVLLELHHDPHDVGAALAFLVDVLLQPGSRVSAPLADLADQLSTPDQLAEQHEAYGERWRAEQRDLLGHEAETVWRRVISGEVRHTGWTYVDLGHEWDRYAADDGQPYPLPYRWERRAASLAEDGMPWNLLQVQVHATLTGPGPRTFDALIRSSRKTLRKLRAYAEDQVQQSLPNVLRGPW